LLRLDDSSEETTSITLFRCQDARNEAPTLLLVIGEHKSGYYAPYGIVFLQ